MEITGNAEESHQNKFALGVDSEHKATDSNYSHSAPHMRAFHLSWISFFACFVSHSLPRLHTNHPHDLDLIADAWKYGIVARLRRGFFARPPWDRMRLVWAVLLPATHRYSLVGFLHVHFQLGRLASSRFSTRFLFSAFVSTQFSMSSLFSGECRHGKWRRGRVGRSRFGLANIFSRPGGGLLSDVAGKKFGMRREALDTLDCADFRSVFCILLGKEGSLSVSIAVMLIFSVFVQAACGLTFGVVPFVSSRDRNNSDGVMIICCTSVIMLIYFPQWGGMFCGPSSKGTTEEDYYMSEWTQQRKKKVFTGLP
ncbi:hypothetical protein DH2020_003591 [Rehmannia glutinosa]|uniref:Uncharacterized protein n=1 Tax=Rehmannia glutinosa TaxID=99300 RepID=A0ABR0XM30_REHGL